MGEPPQPQKDPTLPDVVREVAADAHVRAALVNWLAFIRTEVIGA